MLELMGFRGWAYWMCRSATVFAAPEWLDGEFLSPPIAASSDCWLHVDWWQAVAEGTCADFLHAKPAAHAVLPAEGLVWRSNHLPMSVVCN